MVGFSLEQSYIELLTTQFHEVKSFWNDLLIHSIVRLLCVFDVYSSLEYLFTKSLDSRIVFKANILSHSKFGFIMSQSQQCTDM